MHCGNFRPGPLSRREMLSGCGAGFGGLALAHLLAERAAASGPWDVKATHFAARAKAVIFLYMDGGVSQVDAFDHKPKLAEHAGRDPHEVMDQVAPTQFNSIGKVMPGRWKFSRHGACGLWLSELFPHLGAVADELCMVHSGVSEFPEHTTANYFLHTGSGLQGRPSMGAWLGYGLGAESENLPGFVVLNGGLTPPGGLDCFGSGFLPAAYQGSVLRKGDPPLANVVPTDPPRRQRRKLDLIGRLDRLSQQRFGDDDRVEAAIRNHETAFRMQSAVPELVALDGESERTRKLYGLDSAFEPTRIFGRQCLLARRLVQRGVRFVELTCPEQPGNDRWDQHNGLTKGHSVNARAVDQPVAALVADLKAHGMLDETLVVFSSEFGRTPFAQGADGRDHNPGAFSFWLAGGGVKGGITYGRTDEFGYRAVQDRVEIHDLHATMLHLLGMDHERLTYRWSGRDMRLTDVHGRVLEGILA